MRTCLAIVLYPAACGDPTTPAPGVTSTDVASTDVGATETVGGCTLSADCPGATDRCIGGQCVAPVSCASDKQCTDQGQVCDKAGGACVACLGPEDCPNGQSCKAHQCLPPPSKCASSKECEGGLVCDKKAGECVECASKGYCSKAFACVETVCVPQLCAPDSASCAPLAPGRVGLLWVPPPNNPIEVP